MALSIKDPEADRLARELAAATGQPITRVIVEALQEKKRRLDLSDPEAQRRFETMMQIAERCAALPVYDDRPADDILGYDENGLPS